MGQVREIEPVRYFCGLIGGEGESLGIRACLADVVGPVELESELFSFDSTEYYREEMGPGLYRAFVAFGSPADPGLLADIKLRTQVLEEERSVVVNGCRRRRINLDPGYVTPERVVLATTKDFSHRIYLGRGIYAEITMSLSGQGCLYHPWTYPDFLSGRYAPFFLELRRRLLEERRRRRGDMACREVEP